MRSQNFWQNSRRFPPILIRLLARHRYGKPLTTEEISNRSGLPIHMVSTISESSTWGCCDAVSMQMFLAGCGCDFEDPATLDRMTTYLRRATFKYLRTSDEWESYYQPLMIKFRSTNKKNQGK